MLGVPPWLVISYPPSYPLLKLLLRSCQSLDDGLRVAFNHVEQHQRRTVRGAGCGLRAPSAAGSPWRSRSGQRTVPGSCPSSARTAFTSTSRGRCTRTRTPRPSPLAWAMASCKPCLMLSNAVLMMSFLSRFRPTHQPSRPGRCARPWSGWPCRPWQPESPAAHRADTLKSS